MYEKNVRSAGKGTFHAIYNKTIYSYQQSNIGAANMILVFAIEKYS